MHRAVVMLAGFLCSALALGSSLIVPTAQPIIIAHRGASGYLPEHTLEAKAMAYAQGADFVEQDLVLTKDHVPVVLHDVQIDTVTDVATKFPDRKRADGRWYALDLTLAELKTLNVHERVDPETGQAVFPGRFPLGQGTFRVPTLDEEIDLVLGLNRSTGRKVGIYPEIKSPAWHRAQGVEISPIVTELLTRRGMAGETAPCFLQCFEYAELRRIRLDLKYPGRLIYLTTGRAEPDGPDLTTPEGWAEVAKVTQGIGPAVVQVVRVGPDGSIEPTPLVATAHQHGLLVHPWTVRADALPPGVPAVDSLFQALFEGAKVDGVFTDQPDLGVHARRAN